MENRISRYLVSDELNRDTIPSPDDEGNDMMDDFLESSSKIFHADVARFQLNQDRRLREYEDTLYVWGDKQFAAGMDGKAIDNAIDTELVKFRQMLQYETQQYIIIMKQEQQTRDEAIGLFSMNAMLTGQYNSGEAS